MSDILLIMIVAFIVMLAMNVPIAIAIAMSSFLAIFATGGDANYTVAMKMANGVDSFALLAIPFFILSGIIMGRGGIATRLIAFANALVGWFPGGLAFVNTLTCMFFGAISGSSAAAVSSIGGFIIPEMTKKGYNREFSVAVTVTAATTGLLIPPSNIMIVYTVVVGGGISVGAMFMAGIIPGIITGLSIMAVCAVIAIKRGYKAEKDVNLQRWKPIVMLILVVEMIICVVLIGTGSNIVHFKILSLPISFTFFGNTLGIIINIYVYTLWILQIVITALICFKTFRNAFLGLLLIVIVIGGILGGIFTATEAAAIAVLYAFILAVFVYREIKWKDMPQILLQSGRTTAVVMLLIGASSAMSWLLTTENIPQTVSQALLNISDNPIVILMIINVLLLFVGTFMDMTPAVLIFTPIFLPVVEELGMHPVQFGIMLIANLCIGLCTPPVGSCLFIGCGVGKTSIAKVTKPMLPFFGAMAFSLLLITYIPAISLWLPKLLDLIKK